MRWASWVTFVLGLWLIAVPFVMPGSIVRGSVADDLIVGIVIAAFSLWMAALFTPPPLVSWITVFLGAWVIVSALVFRNSGQPANAFASELIVGVVVLVLALLRALGVDRRLPAR